MRTLNELLELTSFERSTTMNAKERIKYRNYCILKDQCMNKGTYTEDESIIIKLANQSDSIIKFNDATHLS